VEVDVEVERTTEALDQSDRAGSGRLVSVACFSDQMTDQQGDSHRHFLGIHVPHGITCDPLRRLRR